MDVAKKQETGGEDPPDMVLCASGKDGAQVRKARRDGWSKQKEKLFFDTLAATYNVRASAAAVGISDTSAHKRRRRDAGFGEMWRLAVEQGYLRIETLLIENAEKTLAGLELDAGCPVPRMTVKEAMHLLSHHRDARPGSGGPGMDWRRGPRDIAEIRKSIVMKLERIERQQAREEARATARQGQPAQ